MIIDDINSVPELFCDGVRGILLLHRNKDGEKGNAQRKAIKKISRNKEEWIEIIQEFKNLQQHSYPRHRIYSSVNSRNMEKAIHEFKRRQIDVDYGTEEERHWFYVDVQNRFFSCLMNPSCRMQSHFLVDCDTMEEFEKAKDRIPEKFHLFTYPTKNGHHIITRPFNPDEFKVEVKKDDLLFIS